MLDGCLSSVSAAVDEIVVVDTGSTDASPKVAARHGARVLHAAWKGDFGSARNVAIDAARADWILSIDADERLNASEPDCLRAAVRAADLIAVKLRLQPRNGFTAYHEYRLFRRDARIRFSGIIHERVAPSILAVAKSDGRRIGTCDCEIVHVGYEGDIAHKHRRNLPLLLRAVEDQPERVYCWCHLGETLLALGQAVDGEAALRKATEISSLRRHPQDVVEGSLAFQQLAALFARNGRDPLPLIESGLAAFSEDHALRLMRARELVHRSREEEALPILEQMAAIDPVTFFDPRIAFDRRIFGEFAEELRGLAWFRLGRYAEAADVYQRLFEATGDVSHRVRSDLASAKAQGAA